MIPKLSYVLVVVFLALIGSYAQAQQQISVKINGVTETNSTNDVILGATDENLSLLQSERTGSDFHYIFTGIPTSEPIQIELGFAELFLRKSGERVFNVEINDKRALTNFDIISQAGAPRKSVIRRFAITPRRGFLDVHFRGVIGDAKISYVRLRGSTVDVTAGAEVVPQVDRYDRAPGVPETGEIVQNERHATWSSAVPFGGIGTGKFEILPNGEFANYTLNNSWDLPVRRAPGTFIAVTAKAVSGGGTSRILRVKDPSGIQISGSERTFTEASYRGNYPFANWDFDDPKFPLNVSMDAYSPLIPHNERDSGLPLAVVNVTVENPNSHPVATAVALSWEDINGRGGSMNPGDQYGLATNLVHADATTSGVTGVVMTSEMPAEGRRSTFVGETFIGTETSGVIVTRMLNWNPKSGEIPWLKQMARTLRLQKKPEKGAYWSSTGKSGSGSAVVVCAGFHLRPHETKTIPFTIAWYSPQVVTIGNTSASAEYNDYTTSFSNVLEVSNYAYANRVRLRAETSEWHDMISRSNLPRWMKLRLANCLYPLTANSVNLREGKFAMLESAGDMAGLLGACDFRQATQPFMTSMFPALDAAEIMFFAHAQQPDGRIPRYIGNIHGALTESYAPLMAVTWPEITTSWIQQAYRHFVATGDLEFARGVTPHVNRALQYLESADKDGDLLPEGGHMLEPEVPASAVKSSIAIGYMGALRAGAGLAAVTGNAEAVESLTRQFEEVASGTQCLFPNRGDSGCYSDQQSSVSYALVMAGDSMTRRSGLPPVVRDQVISQWLDTVIGRNVQAFRPLPAMAVDSAGQLSSRFCYLGLFEPYLSMAALSIGKPDDAFELVSRVNDFLLTQSKDIWQQSLAYDVPQGKQPRVKSHMSSMGEWNMLGGLTGFAYDASSSTLFFDPQIPRAMNGELHLPVFAPSFWGWIAYDTQSSTGTLSIRKVFPEYGDKSIQRVARKREYNGNLVNELVLPQPFIIREGEVLELDNRPR